MTLVYKSRAVKLESETAQLVYESMDTPLALSCAILLRYGETTQLVAKSIDPRHYNDVDRFRDDYLCVSLLSKSKLQSTDVDLEAVAYDKYMSSEESNRLTNDRIISLSMADELPPVVRRMRWHIGRILGRIPNDIFERGQFGKGSTVGISGVVTYGRKYDSNKLDMTPELLGTALFFLPRMWKERVNEFQPVDYAKLTFVPKNAKTHRAIEVQPSLNIWMQKGVGSAIRDRLKRFGVDLDSQSRNQNLARHASLTNELVTLDLSSASDLIAYEVVKELLPRSWFELCSLSRTKYVQYKKVKIPLEKFSAMGNGYTFELESLIFTALLLSVIDEVEGVSYGTTLSPRLPDNVAVYGDDMIYPVQYHEAVLTTLKFLGFKVNNEKTFGDTYFRESCGADFFKGVNVRPIFLRNNCASFDDFIELCYNYANNLRHYSSRSLSGLGCDIRFRRPWIHLFTRVPAHLRYRVPEGYEANGFLGNFDESAPSLERYREHDGWSGYRFKYRSRPAVVTRRYTYGKLIASLSGLGSDFTYGEEELRGRKLPAATKYGYALAWPNFGPWLVY